MTKADQKAYDRLEAFPVIDRIYDRSFAITGPRRSNTGKKIPFYRVDLSEYRYGVAGFGPDLATATRDAFAKLKIKIAEDARGWRD